eukprot:symbB.v1.2.014951.t1/scaffold1105.1/size137425/2
MREGNPRHEYRSLRCQACSKDIKGYRIYEQEHPKDILDALDIFTVHITGKDHQKKVRHLSEDAVWQKFWTHPHDVNQQAVWLHHRSGQVWKGGYRNEFADPLYDATADPKGYETRLLDWRVWQETQIFRAQYYGMSEKQFASPADPGDGSADTVQIRPTMESSHEDGGYGGFDPQIRSLRPEAADLKNALWDEMMENDEWVRDLSNSEDFDWKTYLRGIPKLQEMVDEVTSFRAELHRTARCSWSDRPMIHFVATTPRLRILLDQHKSRSYHLIYEDLQQNFLSLEEMPVDGKFRLPTLQEKNVVAAFGGNCFYMRKMKNKLLQKSSSSEMSYRELVRRFLKIQSETLTLVEVAEDRNLLEFDCLRLIWKLRCDTHERTGLNLNTEFGDCREGLECYKLHHEISEALGFLERRQSVGTWRHCCEMLRRCERCCDDFADIVHATDLASAVMASRYHCWSGNWTLPIGEIFFTHDSINTRFKDGRVLEETVDELMRVPQKIQDIPKMRVMKYHGRYHSIDNRRLWCIKEVAKRQETSINVTVEVKGIAGPSRTSTVNGQDRDFLMKFFDAFSTRNDGQTVDYGRRRNCRARCAALPDAQREAHSKSEALSRALQEEAAIQMRLQAQQHEHAELNRRLV